MPSSTRSIVALMTLTVLAGTAAASGWGPGGKPKDPPPPPAPCYPSDVTVIDSSGVRTVSTPACATGSQTLDVAGTTAPWDPNINPTMTFAADYNAATPAVAVNIATLGVLPGEYIAVACIGGTTNAGGLPNTGCDGLNSEPFGPTNDVYQPACGTYYPSTYVDSSLYPVYLFQILGSFTTDAGVIVGKPFAVTSSTQNVAVPTGATAVQFGFNECLYSDNSTAPLTVKLSY